MAVLGADVHCIQSVCESYDLTIANYNSPRQLIVAGKVKDLLAADSKLRAAGVKKIINLPVSGAFHTRQMRPANIVFYEFLKSLKFRNAVKEVVCASDGRPKSSSVIIKKFIAKQMISPVEWVKTIENMIQLGVSKFVEIGPKPILSGLIKQINQNVSVESICDE